MKTTAWLEDASSAADPCTSLDGILFTPIRLSRLDVLRSLSSIDRLPDWEYNVDTRIFTSHVSLRLIRTIVRMSICRQAIFTK